MYVYVTKFSLIFIETTANLESLPPIFQWLYRLAHTHIYVKYYTYVYSSWSVSEHIAEKASPMEGIAEGGQVPTNLDGLAYHPKGDMWFWS